ncbi:MAG TPA: DUF3084 domain-containing protein [Candidatus Ozemobacteraceae bacterium]|nr:DUF3084 domain-containing protein [Candidatus Ozemobacteraceae bacterium]
MIQVLVLLVVSAIVAYLGDLLGTWVGKRRLTIFGLRPRATAILVAISTGMLITTITLLTAAAISSEVRIALFSVQELMASRQKLTVEVDGLKKEQQKLQTDISTLQERVRSKEQELVVFRRDEPISAMVVNQGTSPASITAELVAFCRTVSRLARQKGLLVKDEETFSLENREQLEKMAVHIASSGEELVVGAIAMQNLTAGEPLGHVNVVVRPNSLIFKNGDSIASLQVDGSLARESIARSLLDFMEEINLEVVRQGMIGNPLTGRFGDLSSESMLSFYDMVQQIRSLNRKLTVVAVVKEDTYAAGPLNVKFKLEQD